MKKIITLLLLSTACSTSTALTQTKCNPNRLADYGLFTKAESSVQSSDVEGMTGSLEQLTAVHFAFGEKLSKACPSLVINKSFYGSSGYAANFVAAPTKNVSLQVSKNPYPNFSLGSLKVSSSLNLNAVSAQLNGLSLQLAQLNTKSVSASLTNQNLQLVVEPSLKVNAITLSQLSTLEDGSITIYGNSEQVLVINFLSANVSLRRLNIRVQGIKIKNIIWNFVNASELRLANIGGSNSNYADTQDGSVGLQGYILAPNALVQAEEMKITGGLYVNALEALTHKATAQINLPPDQDYDNPCMVPGLPNCSVNNPAPAPTPKPQ